MRSKSILVFAIVILVLAASPVPGAIIDSINADKTPFTSEIGDFVGEIGWLYTPAFSYTLTGIQSKFGAGDGPIWSWGIVDLEIYDGLPINGGALLRSVTFGVTRGLPGGGSFTPLEISGGSDYFVGFRGFPLFPPPPYTIPCNFAVSGVPLPCYYGTDNSGTYSIATASSYLIHPILLFEGVPEPATLLLLGLGGLALLRKRRT